MPKGESELLLGWAAEEFVAAGRVNDTFERQARRGHALFLCDIAWALDRLPEPALPPSTAPGSIGDLLARAFAAQAPADTAAQRQER